MKRKNEKVPEFDEIVFENRNKEYGAYDLRKNYNRTTSISILGAVALGGLVLGIFSFSDGNVTAVAPPPTVVIVTPDYIKPDPVKPEERPAAKLPDAMRNVAPVVSTDTSLKIDQPPIADEMFELTKDRKVNDTITFIPKQESVIPEEPQVYINVKEMPEFPGGTDALMKFISDNLNYPDEAVRNNVQGRVIVKFVVEPDGTVGRIEIISGIDQALNEEAVRVVKSLPTFKPGRNDGVPVPVWFVIPVLFKLENI
jgi:periplasmic protein TonB